MVPSHTISTSLQYLTISGVNVSGEKKIRKAIQTDVYGEITMKQMKFEFKNNTWVKKDARVVEEMDEEAQMDEAEEQGNEEAMHEDQEPSTAPSSFSRVNEGQLPTYVWTFGLFGHLAWGTSRQA
uniref:Uncharacterized protein n=1 Tax=Fagus sylvatica TaxID=28930 RepID=A0A2N9J9D6_FAGSY